MPKSIWLLYRSSFDEKPIAAFYAKQDAQIMCDAINAVYGSALDNDMYVARVEEMPLVGGWR